MPPGSKAEGRRSRPASHCRPSVARFSSSPSGDIRAHWRSRTSTNLAALPFRVRVDCCQGVAGGGGLRLCMRSTLGMCRLKRQAARLPRSDLRLAVVGAHSSGGAPDNRRFTKCFVSACSLARLTCSKSLYPNCLSSRRVLAAGGDVADAVALVLEHPEGLPAVPLALTLVKSRRQCDGIAA